LDLIQLWEDHRFISALTQRITLTDYATSPTFKFDSIYSEILSHSPELLFVLKTETVDPGMPWTVLESCGLSFNYKIFQAFVGVCGLPEIDYNIGQPFARVRGLFPDGDSPVDLLNNPHRAGNLYSDPRDIADTFMRLWIPQLKQELLEGYPPLLL
jgi:hypothetical protein